jgi:hypothetical protein
LDVGNQWRGSISHSAIAMKERFMSDSMVYGKEPLGPRVIAVSAVGNHQLHLVFDDGEQRLFDARSILALPAYKPLIDARFFALAKVEYGTVVWPGDVDCCPDTLYRESRPIR